MKHLGYEEVSQQMSVEGYEPELFRKCKAVHKLMLANSEKEDGLDMWKGFLTSFIEDNLGIEQTHYSKVMGALKSMRSVQNVRRGGGNSPAKWIVFGPPQIEDFHAMKEQIDPNRQRQNDLFARIDKLEQQQEKILLVLEELVEGKD